MQSTTMANANCAVPVHDQASSYLNRLPAVLTSKDRILVVDPMLATGASSTMLRVLPWQTYATKQARLPEFLWTVVVCPHCYPDAAP